jgi:hypothetical protein
MNLFQEVVEILHGHMAGDATVEASAMLPSRSTGALREVDVVIRAKQAGHDVIVSVEAMGRSRPADRTWVDQMVGKHADLPTSKLVLVAQKGFTRDARAAAVAKNAVPLAPEDLPSYNPDGAVLKAVPALWPKVVSFTVEELGVNFTDDGVPTDGWGETAPRVFVDDDGRPGVLGDLMEVTQRLYGANFPELMEQVDLANRTEDSVEQFTFVVGPPEGEEIQLEVNGVPKTLFLLNKNGVGYSPSDGSRPLAELRSRSARFLSRTDVSATETSTSATAKASSVTKMRCWWSRNRAMARACSRCASVRWTRTRPSKSATPRGALQPNHLAPRRLVLRWGWADTQRDHIDLGPKRNPGLPPPRS